MAGIDGNKYQEVLKTEIKGANERVLYLSSMYAKLQTELDKRDISDLSTQDLVELILSVQHMIKEEGAQKMAYYASFFPEP